MIGVCGHEISQERADYGYLYCFDRACFRKYGKRQTVYAVQVNKSIPAIVKVEADTLIKRAY